jgi:hypothetical protein
MQDSDTVVVGPVGLAAGPLTAHAHFTDGILRGGLNYKL